MFKKILVPLDGSAAAEIVLPYVMNITAKSGATISLARVIDWNTKSSDCNVYLEDVKNRVEAGIKESDTNGKCLVESVVLPTEGNPVDTIVKYARATGCDLLVISSRGASNQWRWPLGGVAIGILQASFIPVLLVRKPAETSALSKKKLIEKILVPLDGSELAETVLPFVEDLSPVTGAEVILLQAVKAYEIGRSFDTSVTAAMAAKKTDPTIEPGMRQLTLDYMNGVQRSLIEKGIKATAVILEGPPADKIVDYTVSGDIDLIVMATHGRSGIGRWVFGSVADRVLHAGDKPILLIYP